MSKLPNFCFFTKYIEKVLYFHILPKQHGFKRNKSTATAGTVLQSIMAPDENYYVIKTDAFTFQAGFPHNGYHNFPSKCWSNL